MAMETQPLDQKLRRYGSRLFFKKGSYVYRESDYGESFYYIDEGIITICTPTSNGNERLLSIGKPGAFMGVQGVYSNQYYTNGIALTDCVLYQIGFEQFNQLIQENTKLLDVITNSIRSYSQVLLQSVTIGLMPAKKRIAFIIQIFVQSLGENIIFATITDLARYTSLTRVRVHQVLGEWEKKQIINFSRGKIIVLCLEELSKYTKEYNINEMIVDNGSQ